MKINQEKRILACLVAIEKMCHLRIMSFAFETNLSPQQKRELKFILKLKRRINRTFY